ncbi:MAG: high-affinity branched-chain amino acid ABC transporter permease LivM [Bordetella sp.]|nr:MAG: high-affinity branched-chain amino acid ABC transporter permease LivM [Bordetella sp.]
MKNLNFKNALIYAIFSFILILPIFGFQIKGSGLEIHIKSDWILVFKIVLFIFILQLFRSYWILPKNRILNKIRQILPLSFIKKKNHYLLIFIFLTAVIWPFFVNRSAIDIAIITLIYVTLGISLNIVVGFAGLLNLGFVGFYAIGAYTYAILSYWFSWTFWEALPFSGLISAFFSLLLGFPILRLRGDYLAIVTLGFAEIIRLLLTNLDQYTLGPDGISNLSKPGILHNEANKFFSSDILITWISNSQNMMIYLYLTVLFLSSITIFISNRLVKIPIGRAWEALREDEIACCSLGINPVSTKLYAFVSAALFAGLGGAFFAARQGAVSPESFTFLESTMILSIVVLGGMGSQIGVILAAIFLTIIPEIAREFSEYRLLIFGLLMVLAMISFPQGLFPSNRPHIDLDK